MSRLPTHAGRSQEARHAHRGRTDVRIDVRADLRASAAPAPPPPPPPVDDDAEPLVDLARLRELAGFPLRAVRRRRRLAAGVFAGVAAAAVLAAVVLPRTYHVESRILAQKNVVMPALGNPRRAVPLESDAPTRLAVEAVMSRDNLVQIVRETNLLARESSIRSPLGRVRARLMAALGVRATEAERVDAMVEVLRKRLWVTADEAAEGTVAIGLDWPERRTALAIVTAAQDNFLEQRHATEVARIGESIGILERYVAGARASVDSTLASVGSALPRRAPDVLSATVAPVRPALPAAGPVTAAAREVAGLQASLATRRAEIQDLAASRAARVATARAELADLRQTYGRGHPEVQAAEQALTALAAESPQLAGMRASERAILARLAALGAPQTPAVPSSGAEALFARAALDRLARVRGDSPEDPRLTYAQSSLKASLEGYEDLLSRLEAARIELETARAAFKYRYTIVTPPQLPKRAASPNVPVLLVGGLVAAAALAVFAASALDLAGGRLLEPWQVEQRLGLPLLGHAGRRG